MGRADEVIADLESGGVMSFSELSGFFFNTPHSDDHTTELADLKKKFTAIDTLIAKMKHRDELEPVYKEYQGKSGWSQSRFKKKNAATIEDYEATVVNIAEPALAQRLPDELTAFPQGDTAEFHLTFFNFRVIGKDFRTHGTVEVGQLGVASYGLYFVAGKEKG